MDDAGSMRAWLAIGRGRGWLAARDAGRGVVDDVVALVLHDPRWDRQVEHRARYYATLLLPHHVDLTAFAARAHQRTESDSDAWLAISVLGELARRGNEVALAALRRASTGPHAGFVEHELTPQVSPTSARHIPSRSAPTESVEVGDPRVRLDEIEDALREDAQREATARAGSPRSGGPERRRWLRLLDALPVEHVLPRARAWLDDPWPLSLAAERVLAAHATEDDRSAIEARVAQAHASRAYHRLCSLVDALGTIAHPGSVPLLCRVHDAVAYSYARGRVLVALTAHAHDASVKARMSEGLWDSDAFNRDVAADTCDVSDPITRVRLAELSTDHHEEPFVRETAAIALENDG